MKSYILIMFWNSKMVSTYCSIWFLWTFVEVEYVGINYSRGNIVIMVREKMIKVDARQTMTIVAVIKLMMAFLVTHRGRIFLEQVTLIHTPYFNVISQHSIIFQSEVLTILWRKKNREITRWNVKATLDKILPQSFRGKTRKSNFLHLIWMEMEDCLLGIRGGMSHALH